MQPIEGGGLILMICSHTHTHTHTLDDCLRPHKMSQARLFERKHCGQKRPKTNPRNPQPTSAEFLNDASEEVLDPEVGLALAVPGEPVHVPQQQQRRRRPSRHLRGGHWSNRWRVGISGMSSSF